jgi:CheY-like chemotaxis protein
MSQVGSELQNARVLVVDDEDDTRDVVRIILETHGAQTEGAGSADEGLARLESFGPHVLVSDIAMPGADGYEFIRQIRNLPAERGGRTPAVAVSAHVYNEDRERAYAAGFDAFLEKPLTARSLIECVKRLVERVRRGLERRRADRRRTHRPWSAPLDRRLFQRRQIISC